MSQADFDPEFQWDGQDWFDSRGDEAYELFPPDLMDTANHDAEDVEREMIEPHPGDEQVAKGTDPDEWHH